MQDDPDTDGRDGDGQDYSRKLLAKRLQWPFEDGDDYHPESNRLKMASGTPLTDEDRWPWLEAIHTRLLQVQAENTSEVFACSALRQVYRDLLEAAATPCLAVCAADCATGTAG